MEDKEQATKIVLSQNPWEAILVLMANNAAALSNRANNQALDYDFAVKMGSVVAGQAGETAQQAQVSPIRTGAADTQVQQPAGAVYPPIRNVDQGAASASNAISTALADVAAGIAKLQDTAANAPKTTT